MSVKPYFLLLSFSFLSLVSCARLPAGDGCVGAVMAPPAGMQPTHAKPASAAIGAPKAGALCRGKVFIARQPVKVYRVWDASKPYTQFGKWWSFAAPQGTREQYRQDNVICAEWSPLNTTSSCTLKIGTTVVVGPGQSAECVDKSLLPASATNQVYIANNSQNNVLAVENCTPAEPWP